LTESENLRRLRTAYGAIARGDIDAALKYVDPEAEMRDRPESPDASVYHGAAGARQALDSTYEYFDEVDMVAEEFHEHQDSVVVVLVMRARGRGSSVPVEDRLAHLWTVRGGRLRDMQVYSDPADAMRAAGITPQ
jgi:ketosteroid isomerase-like protein